ncbi:MAG: GTPase Era [Buchnera aphidicola (Schlechtendalia peitan)]
MKKIYHCGTVTIVGKPNVGKSTIINNLVKTKISIVSKRPHTTQGNIIGIQNDGMFQTVYVDTPGISRNSRYFINKKQHCFIKNICKNTHVILLVLNGINWTSEDDLILRNIKNTYIPIIAVINKNDKILKKANLLPYIEFLRKQCLFKEILPISGKTGENICLLSKIVQKLLPISKLQFPPNQITNYNLYFKISEIIREKFIFHLGDEISYSIQVRIENFYVNINEICIIKAIIIVISNQHKKIVIGNKGDKIKLCGTISRKELETYFKRKVHLSLFVKKR